jgi:hypothetical protein
MSLDRARQALSHAHRSGSRLAIALTLALASLAVVSPIPAQGRASTRSHVRTPSRLASRHAGAATHTARHTSGHATTRTSRTARPKPTRLTATSVKGSSGSSSGKPGGTVKTKPSSPGETTEPAKGHGKGEPGTGAGGLPVEEGSLLSDPIDPRFLTKDPFGFTSFWIQPWRAYFDTWPGSTLLNSLGINFNVGPEKAEAVAQLLQESGFKLARKEIPWGAMSYEEPTKFKTQPRIEAILLALKRHDLRPLILLNANSGEPDPAKTITLSTTATAYPGAMTVRLNAASAAMVVPGKTGFEGLTWGSGPDVLITSVNGEGIATLSRPLRWTLTAGKHYAMTLRYAPFQSPTLPNGQPNPVYQETMTGWLGYVKAVTAEASRIFGPGGYDLEVWNELTFGSQFLNYEHYYQPADSRTSEAEEAAEAQNAPGAPEDAETEESSAARADGAELESLEGEAEAGEAEEAAAPSAAARTTTKTSLVEEGAAGEQGPERKDATKASINDKLTKTITNKLLKETVAWVRNPANGIGAGVGITDGFASQTPFPSGAYAPIGLTALSKHLYNGARELPAEYVEKRLKPLNAQGFRDTAGGKGFTPLFVPHYQELFPEYFLTALSTETLVRDIAPITTDIYGLPHGREVGPVGGGPVQKWMTEYNLTPGRGHVVEADGVTPSTQPLTPADRAHFEAKALLRSLVALVGKGLSREYFFAAGPGPLSLISPAFYAALEAHPETYPGAALGGATMSAFRELMARFQGPGPEGQARQLKLLSIAQEGNHAQFQGDGTSAHPSLYDRDMLAVLPFQTSPTRFVIPVYVMTEDLLMLYEPGQPSSDVQRFDLPAESFTVTLGDLPAGGAAPKVSSYDPLRHEYTPARLLSRSGETAQFEVAATDYPRLLTLEYE